MIDLDLDDIGFICHKKYLTIIDEASVLRGNGLGNPCCYLLLTSNREIARILGICRQTVANELNRGQIDQIQKINGKRVYRTEYSAETAQLRYEENRRRCHRPLKLVQAADFIAHFTEHFKQDGWSPDAVVGRAKEKKLYRPEEMVCTATLYSYIDAQLLEIKNIDLLEKTGHHIKHKANTKHKRLLTGRSIDERPKRVDSRREFGHFELDTVVGKRDGQESVIMTFIERKSRFHFMRLIDGRDADSVNYAMRGIVRSTATSLKQLLPTMALSSPT